MLSRVHDDLLAEGFAVTSEAEMGLTGVLAGIAKRHESRLRPDPRGHGKQHARDMIRFHRGSPAHLATISEADSIAHVSPSGQVIDDYSRMLLLDQPHGALPSRILMLIPPPLRRDSGRMSADWFRYAGGTESGAHQDGFGDIVAICVMARSGEGGQSFLTRDGTDVLRRVLEPGEILIFRDEMFHHGLTRLEPGASRDALIFIRLRES